ncbi:hypothetical protein ATANTOWER_027054, partial [Ataeniobius toweri]|nr:hypothetical protein [Ataeniobius toweri]
QHAKRNKKNTFGVATAMKDLVKQLTMNIAVNMGKIERDLGLKWILAQVITMQWKI